MKEKEQLVPFNTWLLTEHRVWKRRAKDGFNISHQIIGKYKEGCLLYFTVKYRIISLWQIFGRIKTRIKTIHYFNTFSHRLPNWICYTSYVNILLHNTGYHYLIFFINPQEETAVLLFLHEFFKKNFNYSLFTMFCQFLLYTKVTQLYIYIYSFFSTLFSIMFHHK